MSFDPLDCFDEGESDCCGARILLGGICSACKEHCERFVDEDEEKDDEPLEIECPYCQGRGTISVDGGSQGYACTDCGGGGSILQTSYRCPSSPAINFPPKPNAP